MSSSLSISLKLNPSNVLAVKYSESHKGKNFSASDDSTKVPAVIESYFSLGRFLNSHKYEKTSLASSLALFPFFTNSNKSYPKINL